MTEAATESSDKSSSSTSSMSTLTSIFVDQLRGLVAQEKRYQVPDYLHTNTTHELSSHSRSQKKKIDDGGDHRDECGRVTEHHHPHDEDDDDLPVVVADDRHRGLSDFQKQRIHWREKICEWCYQVVDHFDLSRECVYVAMHYVDRFTSTMESLDLCNASKDDFQLLSMAALGLALKLYDHRNILVPGADSTIETILLLSRGKFVLSQLEQMEMELLTRLQWLSHPPTPQMFISYILRAYFPSSNPAIRDVALFCIELTVLDYYFVPQKPSEVALASLLLAVNTVPSSSIPNELSNDHEAIVCTQKIYTRLEPLISDRVKDCHDRLERLYSSSVGKGSNTEATNDPRPNPDVEEEERSYSPVSVSNFDHIVSYNP